MQKLLSKDSKHLGQLNNIVSDYKNKLYIFGENRIFATIDGNVSREKFLDLPSEVKDAWISPSGRIYALLNNGSIYAYQDDIWNFHSKVKPFNKTIFGFSDQEIYVAGLLGNVSRYDGKSWIKMKPGTLNHINAMWGTDSDNLFVAGGNGSIFNYRNGTWMKIKNPFREEIFCLTGFEDDTVYFAGADGIILKINNGNLIKIDSGVDFSIEYIWGKNPNDIYFVGDDAEILRLYQGSIKRISPPNNDGCNWEAITGNERGVFIVGSNRTVVHVVDGEIDDVRVLDNSFNIQTAIVIKIVPPGSPLSKKLLFRNLLDKHYPHTSEYYTLERLPGTGNYIEIYEYQ